MHSPARILIACDKFKGSLDAPAVCAALARGLAARFPDALIRIHPIADGGEGFAASLETPLGGRWIEAPSHDALGRPVLARYLLADAADGPLAVIEMAEASGMWRLRPEERDILRASTFGTGELMRHAIEHGGAARMVIGLGGSATNDGGAGMAAALGVRFLDGRERDAGSSPADLSGRLVRIDMSARMALPQITAACDVGSPLLGNDGATRVFGPQKGADANTMPLLENVLETIVRIGGGALTAKSPGAGAAGGLGFGLMHFAGARLVPGFELMAGLTGLEEHIMAADLVITGEGSLDAQSLAGKGPVAIARLARSHGKPVIAFCGKADVAVRGIGLFDSITQLADTRLPLDQLMSRAAELLEQAAFTDSPR
jgi:glycerate kinase